MYYSTNYKTPIGNVVIAGDENNNLVGLWLEGQKYYGASILKESIKKDDLEVFTKAKEWLDKYFNGENPDIKELSLAPIGSEFRQDIWKILCEIPYGNVITYGDIAKKIAKKRNLKSMSAQAIGGAVGHNPISIIIPCHRVVGADKSLTGFAGGLEKKAFLLNHEAVDISMLKIK